MLATIMGATLDFFYFIVGGRLGLLALCATPCHGHRYHWTLIPARGAFWRRGFCSGWSWGPPFFGRWGCRGSVSLLCDTARGRSPRSLIMPCRGARSGSRLSWVLLGSLHRAHHRGLPLGLFLGGLLRGIFDDNRRLGRLLANDIVWINVRRGTNKNMTFYQCQKLQQQNKKQIGGSVKMRLNNLQIGAHVCHCEEPPPGPTSRRRHSCLSKTRRLGMWGRRVTGHPTSSGCRDVWTTARPLDQIGCSVLLLLVIAGDSNEPTTLRSLAGLRRQRLHRRWIHRHWPFPRHPVLGGRGRVVLFLLTTSVLRTLSSIALRRVHSRRIFHTRCQ